MKPCGNSSWQLYHSQFCLENTSTHQSSDKLAYSPPQNLTLIIIPGGRI